MAPDSKHDKHHGAGHGPVHSGQHSGQHNGPHSGQRGTDGTSHRLWDPQGARDHDRRLAPYQKPDIMGYVPSVAMLTEPDMASTQVSSLLYGESGHILEEYQGYIKISRSGDGYIGWVVRQAVTPYNKSTDHIVCRRMAMRYMGPKVSSPAVRVIPLAGRVRVETVGETFAQLKDNTYVPSAHIVPLDRCDMDPVDMAADLLNVPYVWGGRSFLGIDCSGLVQLAYFMAGAQLHRDSDLIADSLDMRADSEPPQRGDIACFKGHVGLMMDTERLVHANQTALCVSIDPVQEVITRSRSHGSDFLGFGSVPAAAFG